jgi:hypothetical protein
MRAEAVRAARKDRPMLDRTSLALAAGALLATSALLGSPRGALAQASPSAEPAAVTRVRELAECVGREQRALQRTIELIAASETQRDSASDPAVRRDAEQAIEALVQRAEEVRSRLRACLAEAHASGVGSGRAAGSPSARDEGRTTEDEAQHAEGDEHGLRTFEAGVELARGVRVVRGEQVDGAGEVESAQVRAAVRGIAPQLEQCRAATSRAGTRELELVFTVRTAGRVGGVEVERVAGSPDTALEQCVRQAGRAMSIPSGARGGDAVVSYQLRFGND